MYLHCMNEWVIKLLFIPVFVLIIVLYVESYGKVHLVMCSPDVGQWLCILLSPSGTCVASKVALGNEMIGWGTWAPNCLHPKGSPPSGALVPPNWNGLRLLLKLISDGYTLNLSSTSKNMFHKSSCLKLIIVIKKENHKTSIFPKNGKHCVPNNILMGCPSTANFICVEKKNNTFLVDRVSTHCFTSHWT